jgi:hypothetical protein
VTVRQKLFAGNAPFGRGADPTRTISRPAPELPDARSLTEVKSGRQLADAIGYEL